MSIQRIMIIGAMVLNCLVACGVTPEEPLPTNIVPPEEAMALPMYCSVSLHTTQKEK